MYEIKTKTGTEAINKLCSLFFSLECTAFFGAGQTSKQNKTKQQEHKNFLSFLPSYFAIIWGTFTTEHRKQNVIPYGTTRDWLHEILGFYLAALRTIYKPTSIKARLMWLKLLHLGRKHRTYSKIIRQRQGSLYHDQTDEQAAKCQV